MYDEPLPFYASVGPLSTDSYLDYVVYFEDNGFIISVSTILTSWFISVLMLII